MNCLARSCPSLFIFAAILLFASPAAATWFPGGNAVCTAPGAQEELQAVADGQGGILMVWTDYRGVSADIYAQRIDADGNALWGADGLAVCTEASAQVAPHLCTDGLGGAWIVWEDYRTDPTALYVQYLNAFGSPTLGPAAILVDELVADAGPDVRCISDGKGGAIISWSQDTFLGPLPFATHLSSIGEQLWGGGVIIGDGIDVDPNEPIALVYDDPYTFAAWIWQGQAVLQRLDTNGLITWGSAGVHPAAPVLLQDYTVAMCSDSAGGIITMWHGRETGGLTSATYAQRLNAGGQSLWLGPPDGVEILVASTLVGGVYGPIVVADGLGGAVAVWCESSMGLGRIGAQRLDATGAKLWGDPFLTVEDQIPAYWRPQVARAGSEFVCAFGPSGGEMDVRVQRMSLAGDLLWPEPVSIDPGEGRNLSVVTGVDDQAFVTWGRRPIPTEIVLDIFATSLEDDGTFTGPNLVVTDVVLADDPGEVPVETTAQITIENVGSMDSGPFSAAYYLDLVDPPNLHQSPLGPTFDHSGLAPGASVVWTTDPYRSLTVDTWTSWAFVDYTDQVVEAGGEDDNIYGPVVQEWVSRPNLKITQYEISENQPGVGDPVTVSITVENDGHVDASGFRIDFYRDLAVSPTVGQAGDQSHYVASLAVGESTTWTTAAMVGTSLEVWRTWAQVDTEDDQNEWKEDDNVFGPRAILWKLPMENGWPVTTGGQCTSPAIGTLSKSSPGARQVVVGCLDTKVYALDSGGRSLPGWPFRAAAPVQSSPALGDVAGDEALEVVFGADDGRVYCVSVAGTLLWDFPTSTSDPVSATPVLTQLTHDASLEIVVGGENGLVYALDGNGSVLPGWPVDLGLPVVASPAAGEMDLSPGVEIVAIGTALPGAARRAPLSVMHVLTPSGTSYSAVWPMNLSSLVLGSPALGNIAGGAEMEIVFGDLDGGLHVWTLDGSSGPFPMTLDGPIPTSPALVDVGNDGLLEIAIASEHMEGPLLFWQTTLNLVNGSAQALPGWPHTLARAQNNIHSGAGPVAWQTSGKKESRLGLGTSIGACFVFDELASGLVHQSMEVAAPITGAVALGELDGDGHMEMVIAGNGEIACYDMLPKSYRPDLLTWPMFRHDMQRTGAYGHESVTDSPPAVPMLTRLGKPHPNPFNATVMIPFTLARDDEVQIDVFDVAGRHVCQLTRGSWPAGPHSVEWHGVDAAEREVASGVYLMRMVTNEGVETARAVLVK